MLLLFLLSCGNGVLGCDFTGCSTDPCEQLCNKVTTSISGCLDEWGASWDLLGASSKSDFRQRCIDEWQTGRSDMEPREIDLAEEECTNARIELNGDSLHCEELRALYL